MRTILMTIWNNIRYWIVGAIMAFLYVRGHQHGKQKEEIKTMKGTLENVKKAKNIRYNMSHSDLIERLHNKYKR